MTIKLLVTDTDNLIQLITAIGNLSVILVLFIIAASVIRWAFTYQGFDCGTVTISTNEWSDK